MAHADCQHFTAATARRISSSGSGNDAGGQIALISLETQDQRHSCGILSEGPVFSTCPRALSSVNQSLSSWTYGVYTRRPWSLSRFLSDNKDESASRV